MNQSENDDNVRPPDPTITEQLIEPDEFSYNYYDNNYSNNFINEYDNIDEILKQSLIDFEQNEDQKMNKLLMAKKQELIDLIGIHLKDYTWKMDEEWKSRNYDNELWIMIQNKVNGVEDNYKICMNINDTWEKNKKRIELNITQYIRKCVICNEIKKLTFCNKCLNQYYLQLQFEKKQVE